MCLPAGHREDAGQDHPTPTRLFDHGCDRCGSIPVFFPDNNDESAHGILTVNYVKNGGDCYGVCTKPGMR